ncbi:MULTISPECIES: XrtA/PEP-CTERM system histidine kinase PrsK [unclassified Sphingomonas]|uniref:XrtA/PEP-CTERM system histidine kinase PrsK n=1 Tax=unclassified Sphingomonas TaxID=196159 RepID=UPI00226A4D4B|nr:MULTISPECIES: XrtA/PEP-CTERM system histidine kinase PrsK [unclassified Sphingomonas]
MTVSLILWGHALAALMFGVLALAVMRRARLDATDRALALALFVTALWALAVAGIDSRDVATSLALAVRNIAWLGLMALLVRRARTGGYALLAVYLVAIGMALLTAILAILQTLPFDGEGAAALYGASLVCRMMSAVAGLVLVHHLAITLLPQHKARLIPIAITVATMWSMDLATAALGYALGAWPDALIAVYGFAMAGAALVLGLAQRRGDRGLMVSRAAALRSLSIAGAMAYAALTVGLTSAAASWAGDNVRLVQTAIIFGATAALMTLMSTPWLRAWLKVKVAKHLFRHRYDYRAEWQRFTDRLGRPGDAADPLDLRIVKAMADLTDAPAAMLLVADGAALIAGASWAWSLAGEGSADLGQHLAASGRIVELDAVRRGAAPAVETAAIPGWMLDQPDAWALVPLIHGTSLIGAILLARPPVDRPLDWEDLDLLRVAGRQAASYLAEDRAHAALADAARFDEFNRRFAFIIHDLKNLVSGLTLVARNAERHADNPDFRADMVATLKDSATRMNALLARLSQHHQAADEPVQPVDAGELAQRLAAGRRAQHPIDAAGAGVALAQPGRLEQLLGHLLQNAVEASPAGAPITVAVGRHDAGIAIDVIDRGVGMSPAFVRDRLFRPFVSSKPGGFGIGAYEARQLATAMGGTLEVASREGEGTRFRLILPPAPALEAAA